MKYIIKIVLAIVVTFVIFYGWLALGLTVFMSSYSNIVADATTVLLIGIWVFLLYVIFKTKKFG